MAEVKRKKRPSDNVKKTGSKKVKSSANRKKSVRKRTEKNTKPFLYDFSEKHSEIYAIGMFLFPIICAVIFCFFADWCGSFVTKASEREIANKLHEHSYNVDKIDDLKNQYNEISASQTMYSPDNYYTGNADIDNVGRVADKFFDYYLTWNNDDEYQNKKSNLESSWGTDGSFHDVIFSEDHAYYASKKQSCNYFKLSGNDGGSYIRYGVVICVKQSVDGRDVWKYVYVTFRLHDTIIEDVKASVLDKRTGGNY